MSGKSQKTYIVATITNYTEMFKTIVLQVEKILKKTNMKLFDL